MNDTKFRQHNSNALMPTETKTFQKQLKTIENQLPEPPKTAIIKPTVKNKCQT